MKKSALAVLVLFLLCMIPCLSSQDKPDVKMMKEKIAQKVADMKAAGASDEEINQFIEEAKNKIAQMNANNGGSVTTDEKVLKEKLDQKVAQMKAIGASDEEIKATVMEFKNKVAKMNADNGNGVMMDEKAFKDRTKQFAMAVVRLVETLPRTRTTEVLRRQLEPVRP